MLRPPPRSPLFPYTTLFRSADRGAPPGRPAGALPHGGAPGIAGDLGRFRLLRAGQPERRPAGAVGGAAGSTRCHRSEEHTSELQSRPHLVCRLLLEKKKHICAPGLVAASAVPALVAVAVCWARGVAAEALAPATPTVLRATPAAAATHLRRRYLCIT